MLISIVVAHDEGRVIGCEGRLPWRLGKDLARFKALTMGKPIIMGRKTYESIGRPLPGRTNIVISGKRDYSVDGAVVVHGLEEAVEAARATGAEETLIIGGAAVYREALPITARVYLTLVHARVDGDVWFPELDPTTWWVVEEEHVPADEKNEYASTYRVYVRW
jgi:dihydrofolate reductase